MEEVDASADVTDPGSYNLLSWRSILAAGLALFVVGIVVHEPFLSGAGVTLIPTLSGLRQAVYRAAQRRAFLREDPNDSLAPWAERDFASDFAKDFWALVPNALLVLLWGGGIDFALSFDQSGAVGASIAGLVLASTTVVRLAYEGSARIKMLGKAVSQIRQVTTAETLTEAAPDRTLPRT